MAAGGDEITHLVNSVGLYSKLATKPFHWIHLGAMLRQFGLVFMSNSWLEEIGAVQREQFYTVPCVRQNTAPSNWRVSFVTNMHHCHSSCWNQLPWKLLLTWEVSTRMLPCYQSSLGKGSDCILWELFYALHLHFKSTGMKTRQVQRESWWCSCRIWSEFQVKHTALCLFRDLF